MQILLVSYPESWSVKSLLKVEPNTLMAAVKEAHDQGYNILAIGDTSKPITMVKLGMALREYDSHLVTEIEKMLIKE